MYLLDELVSVPIRGLFFKLQAKYLSQQEGKECFPSPLGDYFFTYKKTEFDNTPQYRVCFRPLLGSI